MRVRALLLISTEEIGEKDVEQLLFNCHSYSKFAKETRALHQLYGISLNAKKKNKN